MLPSGPGAIPQGALLEVGMGNSVTTPAVVIRPIWFAPNSVNHRLPSEPTAMLVGPLPDVMPLENMVTWPEGAIRPILLNEDSVNHRLPSGPGVMLEGAPAGTGNSLMLPTPA